MRLVGAAGQRASDAAYRVERVLRFSAMNIGGLHRETQSGAVLSVGAVWGL